MRKLGLILAAATAFTAGGAITGFEIAGADGKYVPGEVKVDGNTLLVSSAQVASPMAVRYAWADDPVCNLVNQVGLRWRTLADFTRAKFAPKSDDVQSRIRAASS